MGKVEDVVRKLGQALTEHDAEAAVNLYAPEAVAYDPFYPEPLRGKALREDNEVFFRGFPDLRVDILTVIEQDESSGALEMRFSGTNTGPMASPQGEMPPTNKRIDLKGAAFIRLDRNGKIVEERRYYDTGAMMRQLGLMPEPQAMAAH